jgi:hypothetical protein
MDVRLLSGTFPEEINKMIVGLLRYVEDPIEIRNRLFSIQEDLWVVVKGTQFSYLVSRANKSTGLYENRSKRTKFLIYTPPFTELTPFLKPFEPAPTNWSITLIKKSSTTNPTIPDSLFISLRNVDFDNTDHACESIKLLANHLEEQFWHAFVGEQFTVTLPKAEVEHLVYARVKKGKTALDVVVFRQQGIQKQIKVKGVLEMTFYAILTIALFIGVLGLIRCEPGDKSFVCKYSSPCLYIGLAFLLSRCWRMIVSKYRSLARTS